MYERGDHRGQGRYVLTDSEHGQVWGVCAEVDGFFGEPARGTYEFFGWEPDGTEVHGWVGARVWLVPEDHTLDPWLLEDAESLGQHARTNALVLTGTDDCMGPPEGHRGPVRLHAGHRWLGSCREFARVLPDKQAAPPLVLRGLSPGDRLRGALATGTRRARHWSRWCSKSWPRAVYTSRWRESGVRRAAAETPVRAHPSRPVGPPSSPNAPSIPGLSERLRRTRTAGGPRHPWRKIVRSMIGGL